MPKIQPKKLTDTQIAKLVMKHTDGTSISALAREYKISQETVRRYLKNNATMREECEAIKKEAIGKVLEDTFNELGTDASEILTSAFKQIKKQIPKANLRDLVGLMKVLSDMRNATQENSGEDALDRLCEEIRQASKEQEDA